MSWKFRLFLFLGAPARGYLWVLGQIFGIGVIESHIASDEEVRRL